MGFRPNLPILVFSLCVLALPLAMDQPYYLSVLVFIGIYSIASMGLNLLMGFAGQISLGHAGFYAIGAYTTGILTTQYGVHYMPAAVAAVAITIVIAYIIGIPSLRLKGHYLAMATLAFGEIVHVCLNAAIDLTGGPSGMGEIPRVQVGGFVLASDVRFYYLVWVIFILLFIITRNIVHSRTGRALQAIHGSESAGSSVGINVASLKVSVFVLSAVYAALAGVLYAHFVTFISPSTSDLMFSVRLVTMIVVGGMGHLWGGVLGASILTLLPEFLSILEDYEMLVFGTILLLMVMYMPGGLIRGMESVGRRMLSRREAA